MIDMKVGAYTGTGQQIDLTTGEIGLHTTPTVVKDVVIVGSSFKEGGQPVTHNNTKGIVRAWNVREQETALDISHPPKEGRVWLRYLAERLGGHQRQYGCLDWDHRGHRPQPRLFAGRRSDQ